MAISMHQCDVFLILCLCNSKFYTSVLKLGLFPVMKCSVWIREGRTSSTSYYYLIYFIDTCLSECSESLYPSPLLPFILTLSLSSRIGWECVAGPRSPSKVPLQRRHLNLGFTNPSLTLELLHPTSSQLR